MTAQRHPDDILRAKLNLETAQMAWKDLERFFASGALIAVSRELDLVDVAVRMAHDDTQSMKEWLARGSVARVSDAQAQSWHDAGMVLWTVVVKPWILVQEPRRTEH